MMIVINFRTAITMPGDTLPTSNPVVLATQYARNGLAADLIAALPYAVLPSVTDDSNWGYQLARFVWLFRLRSSGNLEKLWDTIEDMVGRGLVLLVKWTVIIWYVAHLVGCVYWFLSVIRLRQGIRRRGENVWGPQPYPPIEYASSFPSNVTQTESPRALPSCYLAALAWAFSAVSGLAIMQPGSTSDDIFVALLPVLSCLAMGTNAIVIGNVAAAIARVQAKVNKEKEAREGVLDFLDAHKIPLELRDRIMSFYDFAGGVSRFAERKLPALPEKLLLELELYTKRDLFLKVPMFASAR